MKIFAQGNIFFCKKIFAYRVGNFFTATRSVAVDVLRLGALRAVVLRTALRAYALIALRAIDGASRTRWGGADGLDGAPARRLA